MIKDRLGANAVVVNFPIGLESEFRGVVDLVRNQAIIWHEETLGAKFSYEPIPDELAEQAAEYRAALIEAAVEMDDAAHGGLSRRQGAGRGHPHAPACARARSSGKLVPVLCGSAFKNKGVQPLLDAVVDFLPSPLEVPPTEGIDAGHRRAWSCASPRTTSRWPASRSRS